MRVTANNQHWEVLPVYQHDVDGNPVGMTWDAGVGSYPVGGSKVSEYAYKENYYSTNIYSDYFKQLDNGHYFKAMVGFNAELYKDRSVSADKSTLITPSVPTINTAVGEPSVAGGYRHTSVAGFFARLNWNYKDRYMLEANGRYDGSSRFIGDKRWGFFPSFSGGWNIAREAFFEETANKLKIGTLKLRASWGQLGNTNTNEAWYPFYQTLPQGQNYGWLVNGVRQNYASNPGIVSSEKTWETIETWDAGLDWGLFNNRLTGSFDYFWRKTKNMVGPGVELPAILGATVPSTNNTDLTTFGWELSIGWRDKVGELGYGVKLNISDNQTRIDKYPNPTNSLSKYMAGELTGDIYGYTTIGIAKTQEEMDAHIASLPKGGQTAIGSKWEAGDIMYADINGDGKIDNGSNTLDDMGDLKKIGNNTPRFRTGITLDAQWKGFDFSMFWQGVLKRDFDPGENSMVFWGTTGSGQWWSTSFKDHMDYFRAEDTASPLGANVNAYYPRPLFNNKNHKTQTAYLQNAAYMRLKNLQLGYTLPKSLINKIGLQNVRVYVSGENLLTITGLSDTMDPETAGIGKQGGTVYPLSRVYSFGLSVNF